jgi:hypothetical protein
MIKLYNSKESLRASNNYYFSSFGEIPLCGLKQFGECIKSILETEFKIDRDAKFPTNYGN